MPPPAKIPRRNGTKDLFNLRQIVRFQNILKKRQFQKQECPDGYEDFSVNIVREKDIYSETRFCSTTSCSLSFSDLECKFCSFSNQSGSFSISKSSFFSHCEQSSSNQKIRNIFVKIQKNGILFELTLFELSNCLFHYSCSSHFEFE